MSGESVTGMDHADMVGPEDGHRGASQAELNGECVRTLYVSGWPKRMHPRILDKVYTEPTGTIDVSVHQEPIPRSVSIGNFKSAIQDLKTRLHEQSDRGSVNTDRTERRLEEHKRTKRKLEQGEMKMHHVAVYVTIRAESEERANSLENKVRNELTGAQVTFKRARYNSVAAVETTSPLGKDRLDHATRMPSSALATLYPFSANTIIEPSGVLLGYHAVTDAPVMVDRFARDNGYNLLISGSTGDGKSFGSKLMLLRRRIKDPDTIIFIIDPLSDFTRFVDKMEGENIPIGGKRGLNPLDIKQTPQHILDQDDDIDPFGQNLDGVKSMFADYFERRNFDFSTEHAVLDVAIKDVYEQAGITSDVSTHSRQSPTIKPASDDIPNLWDTLGEIVNEPEKSVGHLTESEMSGYSEAAKRLRMAIDGFPDHLSGTNDIDLEHDSQVVNLDLKQNDVGSDIGIMMKELLDTIYQITKTTEKKVVLSIDEAHLLLENDYALEWLSDVTRYARHHDLSLHLATQNIEDFCSSKGRRDILGNCSVRMHWKEKGLDPEHARTLGLSEQEAHFVRTCKPGSLKWGYSHCLLTVEDETLPVKISGLAEEENLIDEDIAEMRGVV